MANPHKGEVTFEAGGKTQTLVLNTNAICNLEDDLQIGITEIAQLLQAGRMSIVRATFRAGLVNGSADGPGLTLLEAGEVVDDVGFLRAVELIQQALERAFPNQEPEAPRPRKAGAGTGVRSS